MWRGQVPDHNKPHPTGRAGAGASSICVCHPYHSTTRCVSRFNALRVPLNLPHTRTHSSAPPHCRGPLAVRRAGLRPTSRCSCCCTKYTMFHLIWQAARKVQKVHSRATARLHTPVLARISKRKITDSNTKTVLTCSRAPGGISPRNLGRSPSRSSPPWEGANLVKGPLHTSTTVAW